MSTPVQAAHLMPISMSNSWTYSFAQPRRIVSLTCTCSAIFLVLSLIANQVLCLPFPAPDLDRCFDPDDGCCNHDINHIGGTPIKFKFQPHLPMRVRSAAHLVDDAYIAKYQRAMELMRALPDTDGRSFVNQYRLHCWYCNSRLYFEGHQCPIEIHQNWLFFPWHRMYLYFHERILAKLLGDDAFALPFWNWDNQSPEAPYPNVVPKVYADARSYDSDAVNTTSSLYDADRNACTLPPNIVDFHRPLNCSSLEIGGLDAVREANFNVMFTHMVSAGPTPLAFFGRPYRLGDAGAVGKGSVEAVPHGVVHQWTNTLDMAVYKDAASDPIFFTHHAQIDRLWAIWKHLDGEQRCDISDPDYLDTEFTFFDENGRPVSASIAQFLDMELLRYKYEEVPIPWLEGNSQLRKGFCNSKSSKGEVRALIKQTKRLKHAVHMSAGPLTFKVARPARRHDVDGEEILEVRGEIDWTQRMRGLCAWAFLPDIVHETVSWGCVEMLGCTSTTPHVGMSQNVPHGFVWRIGIQRKLEFMGRGRVKDVVVTLTGAANQTGFLLTGAEILYSKE